jgi:hypothetical protein
VKETLRHRVVAAAVAVPLVLASAATAQLPVADSSLLRLAVDGQPIEPAKGWALSSEAEPTATVPGIVTLHGPGARITTPTDVALFRPLWRLSGEFTVGASFLRQDASAALAPYGLVVGGDRGLAFVVRGDGTYAIQSLTDGRVSGATWSPVEPQTMKADPTALERLEVRVRATDATFVMSGHVAAVRPIVPGQQDGRPGVYVGADGDVVVVGFSVQSAASLPPPSPSK